MAEAQVIERLKPPQVIEGTPGEIAECLKTLDESQRLTLIIPGTEVGSSATFREIFASSQAGFDQTGRTDDDLSDLLEAEVKAHRAERGTREQQGE